MATFNRVHPVGNPSRKRRGCGLESGGGQMMSAVVGHKRSKVCEAQIEASGDVEERQSEARVEKSEARKERKDLANYRKRRRKPNFDLENDVKILWEKLRQRSLSKEERTKLASEILQKMKGKYLEMSGSHVTSRVLQTCVKCCQPPEREYVFHELRPHVLALARNTYAHHLVLKMLDHATKSQLQQVLSTFHGHVVALLRHPVGSAVVEHVYQLINGSQRQELLWEFYSPEYRLFRGATCGTNGLVELLGRESVSKQRAMLQHLMLALQPILEKGIIDHSITHRVLVEYLSVCKENMVADVVKTLAGPLLIRMIHTRDGAKLGVTCVTLSTAKERKSIIRCMKGHVAKIAQNEHSSIVLLAILDMVDDTKFVSKIIISELVRNLNDLIYHKHGRRCLLHLLAPSVRRYFPVDILEALPQSLGAHMQGKETNPSNVLSLDTDAGSINPMEHESKSGAKREEDNNKKIESNSDGGNECKGFSKKNPDIRRFELLSAGGFGKELVKLCIHQVSELLQSPVGTDVIYEVAMGGVGGVMWKLVPDEILALHNAIAQLAAKLPKSVNTSQEGEHVLEHYHASRTIRRLIINSEAPVGEIGRFSFSSTLWSIALKQNCKLWAKGHSAKVISAYKICRDLTARGAADSEVQGLINAGHLTT